MPSDHPDQALSRCGTGTRSTSRRARCRRMISAVSAACCVTISCWRDQAVLGRVEQVGRDVVDDLEVGRQLAQVRADQRHLRVEPAEVRRSACRRRRRAGRRGRPAPATPSRSPRPARRDPSALTSRSMSSSACWNSRVSWVWSAGITAPASRRVVRTAVPWTTRSTNDVPKTVAGRIRATTLSGMFSMSLLDISMSTRTPPLVPLDAELTLPTITPPHLDVGARCAGSRRRRPRRPRRAVWTRRRPLHPQARSARRSAASATHRRSRPRRARCDGEDPRRRPGHLTPRSGSRGRRPRRPE